ncbi:hypothetical protein [Agromyces seonyuensis]|uniref:hypothetical protein n=1 Tax=Agromyces seonyuensis TaxID=2662446 RepID=UPI001F1DB611|nr:hypothetical protein [Agromyces seonyuensis]
MAWDHERPHKKPTQLGSDEAWRRELEAFGYRPDLERMPTQRAVALDELSVQDVASRALDRCAAATSTWTVHDIQEHVSHLVTEAGVRADPTPLRELTILATHLARANCLSVLPPDVPHPEHVAHLTSVHVIDVETRLRDLLAVRAERPQQHTPVVSHIARLLHRPASLAPN